MTEEIVNKIYEGAANFQKNVETVGGKLFLFEDKLMFEPHAINVQKTPVVINLSLVSEISLGWTKLLGFIPLLANAIIVSTNTGEHYRFTVFGRKEWINKINDAINREK